MGVAYQLDVLHINVNATLLLLARRHHYNADNFSDEPDFNIVYQFNTANWNIFLGQGLNSMSAV